MFGLGGRIRFLLTKIYNIFQWWLIHPGIHHNQPRSALVNGVYSKLKSLSGLVKGLCLYLFGVEYSFNETVLRIFPAILSGVIMWCNERVSSRFSHSCFLRDTVAIGVYLYLPLGLSNSLSKLSAMTPMSLLFFQVVSQLV